MPDITPTQGNYLSYIHAYTVGIGLPPAESEIAKAINRQLISHGKANPPSKS